MSTERTALTHRQPFISTINTFEVSTTMKRLGRALRCIIKREVLNKTDQKTSTWISKNFQKVIFFRIIL